MADVVLRVSDLKVACGGLRAARSARTGGYSAPPSPALPFRGGSTRRSTGR